MIDDQPAEHMSVRERKFKQFKNDEDVNRGPSVGSVCELVEEVVRSM